jgi:hypothetical protein
MTSTQARTHLHLHTCTHAQVLAHATPFDVLYSCTHADAIVAVAANFTTKYATQLLPGAPDIVLFMQLAVMLAAVQFARIMGLLELPPLSLKRLVINSVINARIRSI